MNVTKPWIDKAFMMAGGLRIKVVRLWQTIESITARA